MKSDWLESQTNEIRSYLTLPVWSLLAAFGAANWLANRHNKSFDATSNKRFSLSDQTIKVVKGLEPDVDHHLLRQKDLHAPDLLDRYYNLSRSCTWVRRSGPSRSWRKRRACTPTARLTRQREKKEEAKSSPKKKYRRADSVAEERRA